MAHFVCCGEDLGTTVLSPYSLDLSPIEHQWVQTKFIRRQYHYEVDTLFSEHLPYDKLEYASYSIQTNSSLSGCCRGLTKQICHILKQIVELPSPVTGPCFDHFEHTILVVRLTIPVISAI